MSFFKKVPSWRKSKDRKGQAHQESIRGLRKIEDKLNKMSEFLEEKVKEESTIVKKNATKNKRVALAALKRKKLCEKQLLHIGGTLSTIKLQRAALENAKINAEVFKAMASVSAALKSAHHNIDIEKVHSLMEDVVEQQEIGQEISDAISNPAGFGQDVDETS
ncbi:hypothetical protein CHS0354_024758 [Potamilus streckersoni]|uniref:Uncharacterized protein n=1 Tax=Potamilus streckersoni TaxID=2493646 RepID=A0AAE0RXM9_9BIVA|nr:hypothetical protein CHS0354_024758 [Potamilus streckersoni]